MFYVGHYADDGHPLWWPWVARPADAHADWVFVRQKFPHHFLVHNCHQWLLFAVQGGEVATHAQGNLHHVEVITHHRKGLYLGLAPHGHRRASVDDDTVAHIIPAERYISYHPCLHAWERIQAGKQLAAKLGLFGDFAVSRLGQLEIHRHYVRGIETGVHRAQP